MKHVTIREVFEHVCAGLQIDHKCYRHICDMESSFVNKKKEHIEFFGGNLTGVQVVRFTDTDRDKLFDSILQCDDTILQEQLYALKEASGKPVINQEWFVVSDIFNLSSVWLLHAIHISPHLDAPQKKEAKVRVTCYLLYKFLTSLLSNYFKYPADPEIAAATYAQLSYKYALKQKGSWGAALRNLAENAVSETGIHADTIERMNDDQRVLYFLGNVQGGVRDMLKNIYAEFVRAHSSGTRITRSSSLVESDGELILRDNVKSPGVYSRYLKGIVSDKNTFIKPELVDIITNIMHTLSPRLLNQTLVYTSEHYQKAKEGNIDKAIDIVLEHAIEYTSANRQVLRSDLPAMIDCLRGAYMSSRSTDVSLLAARKLVEQIVRDATGSKNESGIAAVRTAWMLYVVIRAYSRNHYANH